MTYQFESNMKGCVVWMCLYWFVNQKAGSEADTTESGLQFAWQTHQPLWLLQLSLWTMSSTHKGNIRYISSHRDKQWLCG